jgi:hypothetical protein
MNERFPTTERKWRSRQRVIKAAGSAALEKKPTIDANRLPDPDETNKYEMQAARAHRRFIDALDKSKVHEADEQTRRELALAPGVEHGYSVVARTIGFAAQAYKKFLETDPWHEGSVEELGALLWSDQAYTELVTNLAAVPGDTNGSLEEAYSLFKSKVFNTTYESNQPPFVVSKLESGELQIRPQEELQAEAYGIIKRGEYTKYETCPAHDVLLRPLWEDMIIEAAVDPNLFAADLGLVNAA